MSKSDLMVERGKQVRRESACIFVPMAFYYNCLTELISCLVKGVDRQMAIGVIGLYSLQPGWVIHI